MNLLAGMGRWSGAALMALALLSGCGGGGGGGSTPPPAANAAPSPVFTLSGLLSAGGAGADASAVLGNTITLSASGSTDADGDVLTYQWSVVSKPAASTLSLTATGTEQTVKPDVAGAYAFRVRVTDTKGAFTEKTANLTVISNEAPVTNVVVTASYAAVPSRAPIQTLSIGSSVVLDSSSSTDADGDPVVTTWELIAKPVSSTATLTGFGVTRRFVPDLAGLYEVRARGTDPGGAYSERIYSFNAHNRAPQTVIVTNVTAPVRDGGSSTLQVSTGYIVSLSGATTVDPDGDVLTYAWSIVSKPAWSTASLSTLTGLSSQLIPDAMGDYVVKLDVSDPSGAKGTYLTTIEVRNQRPLANISSNATPVALASGPAVRLPVNTLLTLRSNASFDADGDALTYSWTLLNKPANSTAVLSASSGATVQITPDQAGTYDVRMRATDTSGAYSERDLALVIGNWAPVAVVDKYRASVILGKLVKASAAYSYDDDYDALTYSWSIDARPVGSTASIAQPNLPTLAFTPDMTGEYVAAVTVSDGRNSSVAYVNIKVLAVVATNVYLPFVPGETRYSRGLDKLITLSANPNLLHILDPFTGTSKTLALPATARTLSLSPNGKLAAVLHTDSVTLFDLEAGTMLRNTALAFNRTDVMLTDSGASYLIGSTVEAPVSPAIDVIDLRTGTSLSATLGLESGDLWGAQRGIVSKLSNKIFLKESHGLRGLKYFNLLSGTGKVSTQGELPTRNDYTMHGFAPMYLTEDETILMTISGNFYNTETLQFMGNLTSVGGPITSMSNSREENETLLVYSSPILGPGDRMFPGYFPSYLRFTGNSMTPNGFVPLPLVDGQQSYAKHVYHSANGYHISLVQTMTQEMDAAAARYYVLAR